MSERLLIDALKRNARFVLAGRGQLSTEDLFKLPLTSLDDLARNLHTELQAAGVSFIEDAPVSKQSQELSNNLEVVKLVIAEVQANKKKKAEKAAMEVERRRLVEALHDANSKELSSLGKEAILARLAALDQK